MLTKLVKVIIGLLLVIIISVVVFVSVFDANEYKPEIIAQVEQATGRDFSIEGDIGLTLYPWIGLKLETTRLGNAKGFSQNSFASLEQLNVKINVLPLLKKEIEINKIQLQGLTLSLEVNEDGKTNWEDLAQSQKEVEETSGEVAKNDDAKKVEEVSQALDSNISEDASSSQSFALESLKVEGFEFVDARINFIDKSKGSTSTISDLNLQTGAIQFDEPVNIQFSAHVENSAPVLDSQIKMTTSLTFNQQFSLFTLQDFLLTVAVKANDMVKQDVELVVKAQTNVDMDKELVDVEKLQIDVLGVSTVMDMRITQFSQAPVIDGNIKVKEFNANVLSEKLGVVLPDMADKNSLSKVSISTQLKMVQQQLQLNKLNIQLDESTLTGWLRIPNLDKQQIRYDLLLDKINLNSYMPPASASAEAAENEIAVASGVTSAGQSSQTNSAAGKTAKAKVGGKTAKAKAAGDEKIELPIDMLRSLDVAGVFAIDALHVQEFDVSQLSITTKAKNGDINIKPIKLNVLDGSVDAGVRLDVRKNTPAYSTNVNIKDVQAGPLANPSLQNMTGDKPMSLTGTVNVTAAMKSWGNTVNALKKKAKGKVTLDMNKTSVKGFDPEYFARSSVADYLEAKGLGEQASVRGKYEPRKVTVFDTIHGTATIANGKVTTKDFLMNSKRVVIKAKGGANIMNDTMDATSSITLPRGKTAVEKLLSKPLYVRVHGPFNALKYDVDTKKLSKNVGGMLEDEAKQKVDKELNKQKKKLEKKFGDELKNKFKGLF